MTSEPSAVDVAQFMAGELAARGSLYQEDVVYQIERRFGSEFTYTNENGNQAISRRVLTEFRKLTPDAVWERGSRMWRQREPYDESATRLQD